MTLKDATYDLHKQAEKNPFAQLLLSGNITETEYAKYLVNLMPIYHVIENVAGSNGHLVGVEDIQRNGLIHNDIKELEQLGADLFEYEVLPSTVEYVDYLYTLSDSNILAHLYTRHFGDLYGGQILKSRVPGSGSMYEFNDRKGLIEKTRTLLSDDLGPEARIAFSHAISLFNDLSNELNLK